MKTNVQGLFVYGTFKDEKIQKKIFERAIKQSNATLHGYYIDNSEKYYDIVAGSEDDYISGKFLYLDTKDLLRADQWENVPLYVKEVVEVDLENGERLPAYIYKKSISSQKPSKLKDFSSIANAVDSYSEVDKLVLNRDDEYPISDMYLFYPVRISYDFDDEAVKSPSAERIISRLNEMKDNEINEKVWSKMSHLIIASEYIYSLNKSEYPVSCNFILLKNKDDENGICHPEIGVLILTFTSLVYNPYDFYRNAIDNKLYLGGKRGISDFLEGKGITIIDKPTFALFTYEEIEEKLRRKLFSLDSSESRIDLTVSNKSSIYASDNGVIDILHDFHPVYYKRLANQSFILSSLQRFMLQVGNLLRNNKYKSPSALNLSKVISNAIEEENLRM